MKLAVLFMVVAVFGAGLGYAQDDEPDLGWRFKAELSGLWNSGNSVNNSFGVATELKHLWPKSTFKLNLGGTQSEATVITRFAKGTAGEFVVEEDRVTEKTGELYFGRARFDHSLTPRFYTFGALDWLRNKFAGVDSRFLMALGAGNQWVKNDRTDFKTDYAVTYTFQEEVVENPITGTNFPGLRIAYDLEHQLTASTEFLSWADADMNLEKTEDVRVTWFNGFEVGISEQLFFKPGFTVMWRNEPAFTTVDLFDSEGNPTGETVPTQLDQTDTVVSLSLLAKF